LLHWGLMTDDGRLTLLAHLLLAMPSRMAVSPLGYDHPRTTSSGGAPSVRAYSITPNVSGGSSIEPVTQIRLPM